ncbi:MAG: ribbon-helix-helix domain-containing protein [Rhizobium sp.]|jgi:predicted transcriptional regulator|nr:ribbon-helix-helix domain-containing protein [Rhizobium sp.]MCZ8351134.1 ribbon-helix-helix domain-containing protein [Rhizobium sp.]
MRISVDIPDAQVEALDRLAQHMRVSRADLIKMAVQDMLDSQQENAVPTGFGLWASDEDGLAIQRRLRSEWEE